MEPGFRTIIPPSNPGGFQYLTILGGTRGIIHNDRFLADRIATESQVFVSNLPVLKVPGRIGGYLDVTVVYTESVEKIFVQLQNESSTITDLSVKLQRLFANMPSEKDILVNPMEGQICAAKYNLDQQWYRAAVIERPNPKEIKVFFVDYGNMEMVKKSDIKKLPEEFHQIAPMAVELKLNNVGGNRYDINNLIEVLENRCATVKLDSTTRHSFIVSMYVTTPDKGDFDISKVVMGVQAAPPAQQPPKPTPHVQPAPTTQGDSIGARQNKSAFGGGQGAQGGGTFGQGGGGGFGQRGGGGGGFGQGGGRGFGGGARAGGRPPPGPCRKCNQEGHWMSECPNAGGGDGFGGGGRGFGCGGCGKSCFNCGEEGHISRECPNPKKEGGGFGGGGGGGRPCFNCRKEGHTSRDCPEPKRAHPGQCRKCNQEGHWMRDCPNDGGNGGGGGGGFGAGGFGGGAGGGGGFGEGGFGGGGGGFGGGGNKGGGFGGGGFGVGGGGGRPRFNYRKEGHTSRDCPEPKRAPPVPCRKCNQEGHWMRDCPNDGGNGGGGGGGLGGGGFGGGAGGGGFGGGGGGFGGDDDYLRRRSVYGNSTETSKSDKLRQEGNDYYKRFQDGNSCGMSERYIKTAGNLYRQAVECSENKNDQCMASKNLGLASWRLAMCYLDEDFSPHMSQISSVFVEAVDAFSKAENIGVEIDKGDNWLKSLRSKSAKCLTDLSAFLVDYMANFSSRASFLHDLLLHCHSNWWKGRVFIELATTNFKYAVVQMTGKDQLGFTSALAKFGECYFPIQEAKRLLGSQDNTVIDLSDEIHEQIVQLEQDVIINTSAAQSLQAMSSADRMLEKLLCEEENLNMHGVDIVKDRYKEATILTRGNHIEYEAMANSKLGQLYMKVLRLEKRGKDYLMHCMELSNSLSPRNFSGYDWFDKASVLLRELQEGQKRRDDEKWRKEREPYLKQLIKELAVLENLSEQSAEVLIKELPTKLPAKHRKKSELLNKEDLSKVDRTEIKKLLRTLILLYHPDHVDKKEYGTKYYVLCEEITKVITGKYECFK